jgi:outer membrane biogenesis lipoprotein LolB
MALVLGACTAMAPPAVPLDGVPAAFRMAGRLSIAQDGQGEIFRLRWERSLAGDTWTVLSPVGTEVARIERLPDGVQVFRPGAAPLAAASLADVTQALFGADLDERLLAAWLHGRAHGGASGWRVQIEPDAVVGPARRVVAVHGQTTVRLVVDDYEVLVP